MSEEESNAGRAGRLTENPRDGRRRQPPAIRAFNRKWGTKGPKPLPEESEDE